MNQDQDTTESILSEDEYIDSIRTMSLQMPAFQEYERRVQLREKRFRQFIKDQMATVRIKSEAIMMETDSTRQAALLLTIEDIYRHIDENLDEIYAHPALK